MRNNRLKLLVAGVVLAGVSLWMLPAIRDNFAAVLPGRVYRSGQLSADALERYIRQYGLRSIINLRGSNPEFPWYRDERDIAQGCAVRHYDIGLDSRYPYVEELREVIETLETCPKPVLCHCGSGVDRTGTVAAVAVLLDEAGALTEAEKHFGLRHLQLAWRPNAVTQRAFLAMYREWLARHDLGHTPAHFREWALHAYERPPDEPPAFTSREQR
jgi:undecaprenyl-diphosphatase